MQKITNLYTAKIFLSQCKRAIQIKISFWNKYIICLAGNNITSYQFSIYQKTDKATLKEEKTWYGIEAIQKCYEYRKYINRRKLWKLGLQSHSFYHLSLY